MTSFRNRMAPKALVRRIGIALGLTLIAGGLMADPKPGSRDLRSDEWAATDALGRSAPEPKESGAPKKDRFVGIFYFLWLGAHGKDLYDNSRLLAANPSDPAYGPPNAFHWWGEPRLGYYLSDDEYVIRKHVQMLTDAGVDVAIFDVTNAVTYDENYLAFCRVCESIRKTGRTTPQIAFITHSSSADVVKHLYENFYAKNLYPDLWFRWKGKPLLLSVKDGLSEPILSFFSFRESWAWSDPNGWFGDGKDKWPWLDNYPQNPGWHEDPKKPEQISVSVAQHPVSNIGRSFHGGAEPDKPEPEKGLCFSEQFERALKVDPEFVFITGWNEWVAMRFLSDGGQTFLGKTLPKGGTFFVDEYDEEYSRDIEPMREGHADDYYYQMVSFIRRYKGVRAPEKASAAKTIRIDHGFDQWNSVKPEYLDDLGDAAHRDHPGWGGKTYVDDSGRNDFDLMKVARDADHLYFYARTREPITPPSGSNWMLLFIDADGNPKTGWHGYDFVVNRSVRGDSESVLERNVGGKWEWKPVAEIKYRREGRELQLAIPRKALGLEKGPLRLNFKWADHSPEADDIMDFMDKGDVAPNGRFSYRYEE